MLPSSSGGQARPGYPLSHATTFTQAYHQFCAAISGVTAISQPYHPLLFSESWNLRGGRGDALHRVRPRGCCGFWGRRWGRFVERFGDVHEPVRVHASAGEDTGVGGAQELYYREEVTGTVVLLCCNSGRQRGDNLIRRRLFLSCAVVPLSFLVLKKKQWMEIRYHYRAVVDFNKCRRLGSRSRNFLGILVRTVSVCTAIIVDVNVLSCGPFLFLCVCVVAARASRVWARYFVKCAICESSFTRHGGNVEFCVECKCHVCDSCNCTVFHLDYQVHRPSKTVCRLLRSIVALPVSWRCCWIGAFETHTGVSVRWFS